MKGKPTNLCPRSLERVKLVDAVLNGIGEYVELCACGKYVVLRVSSQARGRVAFGAPGWREETGVTPRHNGRVA